MKTRVVMVAAASLFVAATQSQAQVVRVTGANFTPSAGVITFSEFPVGTTNPTYLPAQYGGTATSPTVTTGGFFVGQSLSANPSVDCPGAAATACVVGSATGPLTLNPLAPATMSSNDGAQPTSPILSGNPLFNGPISVLFSTDQVAVGFDGGYFDAIGSTAIVAYARDGSVLGSFANTQIGVEFLGLGVADGTAKIAGVGLRLVGNEPAGFDIDNLRFGVANQVVLTPSVPEPATWAMMIAGIGVVGFAMRRRRQATVRVAFTG